MLLFAFKSLLLLALLLVALVAFSLRPNVVLGTDGGSLARSLNGGGALADTLGKDCRKTDPGSAAWRCTSWLRGGSEGRGYRLTVDWKGCWSARRMGNGSAAGAPSELSGCVSALDHLPGL